MFRVSGHSDQRAGGATFLRQLDVRDVVARALAALDDAVVGALHGGASRGTDG